MLFYTIKRWHNQKAGPCKQASPYFPDAARWQFTKSVYMGRLGLLARMAFICNLFFLLCLLLQYRSGEERGAMISLVAILGLILGMGLLNPLSNILNAVALVRKKAGRVPRWLAIANGLFLILQIVYLLHTLL